MVWNPRPGRIVMPQDAETPPVRQFLLDQIRGRFGLQAERMAAEVQQLAPRGIVRMVELLRETGERVRSVEGCGAGARKILRRQEGACMTVPHTLQVRRCRSE